MKECQNLQEFLQAFFPENAEMEGFRKRLAADATPDREGLTEAGLTCFGGVNAPYIWLKTPDGMGSWEFFDKLLKEANVVTTPGAGFGPSGEGYIRLTAFGDADATKEAVARIRTMLGR